MKINLAKIIGSIIILIVLLTLIINVVRTQTTFFHSSPTSTPSTFSSTTPSQQNQPHSIFTKQVFKGYQLQILSGNQWETIYDQLEDRPFLLTDDYFIIGTSYYQTRAQVTAFNTKTNEELILYNEYGGFIGIEQIIRIDNTLFFTIGGMRTGGLYAIDFPLTENKIVKISDLPNVTIKTTKIPKRYWLVSGKGDGCGGFAFYEILDQTRKTTRRVAKASSHCGIGNKIIPVRDRVLSLYFTGDEFTSTYTHVTAIHLNDVSNTEVPLIDEKQMPKDVREITYDEETNSLHIQGLQKYIFDLNTNTLIQKDFPEVVNNENTIDNVSEINKRAEEFHSLELPETFRIIP